ncbi:hypothetical protein SATMO3_48900 [Sporomusa aerivorans]
MPYIKIAYAVSNVAGDGKTECWQNIYKKQLLYLVFNVII